MALQRFFNPILILAATVTIFSSFAYYVYVKESDSLVVQTKLTNDQVKIRLETYIQTRLKLLKLTRQLWHNRQINDERRFREYAKLQEDTYPGLLAFNWVDENQVIRWVVPEGPNRAAKNQDLKIHPLVGPVVKTALKRKQLTVSPPIELYQGGLGFTAYDPLYRNNQIEGFLNAVFRLEPMVRSSLSEGVFDKFYLTLEGEGKTIFRSSDDLEGKARSTFTSENKVVIFNRHWEVQLTPKQSLVDQSFTMIPFFSVLLGALLGFVLVWFSQSLVKTSSALQKSEFRYRSLLEDAPDTIIELDADGRVIFINRGFFGLPIENIVGTLLINYISPRERKSVTQTIATVIKSRTRLSREVTIETNQSSLLWACSFGPQLRSHRLGCLVIAADMTEERAAKRLKARLLAILEATSDFVGMADANGQMVYINQAGREMLKLEGTDSYIGKPISSVHPPEDFQRIMDEGIPAILKNDSWENETAFLRSDGVKVYTSQILLAHRSNTGELRYISTIARDVTAARKEAKERQELLEHLRQRQKLETIGTLASGIAHDFNNILTPILGYSQLAKNFKLHGEELETFLDKINVSALRAQDLVRQILTFGRRAESQFARVNLVSLVNETLELVRASMPSSFEILSFVEGTELPIFADSTQIQQVLMNLCTNAWQAMTDGEHGTLTLEVSSAVVSESFVDIHPKLDSGKYYKIMVSDTGKGMERSTLDRIFDPFFTTKTVGEGTGLGLSIVHSIVIQHSGEITVDSRPGVGTTFIVYLPQYSGRSADQFSSPAIAQSGHERVMVIDDEVAITDLLTEFLGSQGYQVTVFNDSQLAFKEFQAGPDDFDLVITDFTMPQLSGVEVAKHFLEIRPELPIVLLSGITNTFAEDKLKEQGFRICIEKPFQLDSLMGQLRRLLDSELKSPSH